MKNLKRQWYSFVNYLWSFAEKQSKLEKVNSISDNLLKAILFDTTTEEQILIFEDLKSKFAAKLHRHNQWAKNESFLINGYLKDENVIRNIQVNDPVFENPLKTVVN